MNFNKAEFIKSAASAEGFISDGRPQIVFAGRSNVGKSSVINKMVNRKNFARVGAAPGKTSHINYFLIEEKVYLVDLPGYGYAKVSQSEKERWGKLMESYFAAPGLINAGILIVDARHKPTADDRQMADWFKNTDCPFIVCANKTDKVKKSELECNLELIVNTLELDDNTKIIPFSAETGLGRNELIDAISSYLAEAI